jgi:GNAT superfamily N-acetyltransferase
MHSLPRLSIRVAHPADRDVIARLTREANAEHEAVMEPSAFAAMSDAIERSLADETGITRFVAELDGTIVGSAALYAPASAAYGSLASPAPWPEVRLVAVATNARGRGIGEALVAECARHAKAAGATALGLHTSRSLRAARRLYERMGFVRDPEHDFHPPGAELVEGYVMRLDDAAPTPEL